MGNIAPAVAALCQGLKIPFVRPEPNSQKTLADGMYFSPEDICLPFKLILGNLIDGVRQGADTILMVGSCGPCRFGEYIELLMNIFREMGFEELEFIVADISRDVGTSEFLRRMGRLAQASPVSRADKYRALITAYRILKLSDALGAAARYKAGFEAEAGNAGG